MVLLKYSLRGGQFYHFDTMLYSIAMCSAESAAEDACAAVRMPH